MIKDKKKLGPIISSTIQLLNLELAPKTHARKLQRFSRHCSLFSPSFHLWKLKCYPTVSLKCGLTCQTLGRWNMCLTSSSFLFPSAGGILLLWLILQPDFGNFLCVSMSLAAFVSSSTFLSHSVSLFNRLHVLNCFYDVRPTWLLVPDFSFSDFPKKESFNHFNILNPVIINRLLIMVSWQMDLNLCVFFFFFSSGDVTDLTSVSAFLFKHVPFCTISLNNTWPPSFSHPLGRFVSLTAWMISLKP